MRNDLVFFVSPLVYDFRSKLVRFFLVLEPYIYRDSWNLVKLHQG